MNGYIHLYTGNGKGKTTAAFGMALRAIGAAKKVFIAQFVKGMPYSEIESVRKYLPDIKLKQFGLDCFIKNKPTEKDIEAAKKGLNEVAKIITENEFEIVILDEACIALYYNLFSIKEFIDILKQKPDTMEIIITGRNAPQELIDFCDLVTDMKEIKHYYNQGVEARKGIEF